IRERVENPSTTYSAKIARLVNQHGYVKAHMILARNYYGQALEQVYRLQGFEHLELSTQILLRDAIKYGIEVEVLDETDNFIALKKDGKIEYIQQATKTSLDSYSTVLVMENKVVTKKVLERAGIPVPQGQVFQSISQAQSAYEQFGQRSFVVKPKSTNFGLGISIFTQGCNLADYTKALDIAFAHDHDIIVEAFVPGKEYRFLIIDHEVVGVLHRVPANVIGDGSANIRELVAQKNLDPLRGVGYKTPLEKIKLDDSARLFLAQQHLNFDSIPAKDQIIYLRENSNISTGGDSLDFTDQIHPSYFAIAKQAAAAVDANICGVDMMIEDLHKFDEHHAYAIIELNFNPAIHIHCFPYQGSNRQAGVKILQALNFIPTA
ncbi:MAG: bifunctional glutamate--cysteine ligase GshA/glutathione synthetase GshB, partial [Culicoidibacterales bacterium]